MSHEILTIDLNFQGIPQSIAVYAVRGPDGVALIETGPASTLDTLLSELRRHGIDPASIRHVLVTHIHLDHAGAAGWWAQQGATVYVHERGAKHLIDPSRLLSSAGRIYGAMMDTLWGTTVPAPEENVRVVRDDDVVEAAGLAFRALDTPGHARHHHAYLLGDMLFTGDVAAVYMPDTGFVSLPAPPPEFDVEAWEATIDRLLLEDFDTIYPTHFGPVDDGKGKLRTLRPMLREHADFVKARLDAGDERDAILRAYLAWYEDMMQAAGLNAAQRAQFNAANPLYMSVDGIIRYWEKRAEAA